jgi:DNA-binding transcriptional ArsR family regulator
MSKKALKANERQLPTYPEIERIVRDRKLGFSSLAVLMNLKSRMNVKEKRFFCWPSQKRIADDLGIAERQVRRILKRLQEAGLIRIEKRKGGKRFENNLCQYSFVCWWKNEEIEPDISARSNQENEPRQTGHFGPVEPDISARSNRTFDSSQTGHFDPVKPGRNVPSE